jgi:hypothetical protein
MGYTTIDSSHQPLDKDFTIKIAQRKQEYLALGVGTSKARRDFEVEKAKKSAALKRGEGAACEKAAELAAEKVHDT